MSEQIVLQAQQRSIAGKAVRQLRRQGILPANIYGNHRQSVAIQIPRIELERIFKAHGAHALFRLTIMPGGVEDTALVRHIQREPTTGAIQHVDFYRVQLDERIRARVPLRITGEAPAVKTEGGVLLHTLDALELEALPASLPQALTVDISGLRELNSSLTAGDVPLPPDVTLLTSADEIVITIMARRTAAAEATAAPTAAKPAEETTSEPSAPTDGA